MAPPKKIVARTATEMYDTNKPLWRPYPPRLTPEEIQRLAQTKGWPGYKTGHDYSDDLVGVQTYTPGFDPYELRNEGKMSNRSMSPGMAYPADAETSDVGARSPFFDEASSDAAERNMRDAEARFGRYAGEAGGRWVDYTTPEGKAFLASKATPLAPIAERNGQSSPPRYSDAVLEELVRRLGAKK